MRRTKPRHLLPVVILFTQTLLSAQTSSDTSSLPVPSFLAIIVSDIDTSIDWYQEVLGLTLRNRIDVAERGLRQANLHSPTTQLELIQLDAAVPPDTLLAARPGARLTGFFKFGFTVPDLDAMIRRCEIKGITVGNVVGVPETGKRMTIIRDPDGNRIQLFER
ncbi:MAG: VOC family protein [Saprospiraceae bacterium]|nr:VOC family protein [Saprospiraceae bacterium]